MISLILSSAWPPGPEKRRNENDAEGPRRRPREDDGAIHEHTSIVSTNKRHAQWRQDQPASSQSAKKT